MKNNILKEAIEYTKTQSIINSRKLQLYFDIGYHVADNLIMEMKNGGLIEIDARCPYLKDYIVKVNPKRQIPIMPPDISSEYDRILEEKIYHYGESKFAYSAAASEYAQYYYEFYTNYNKINPKFNGDVLDKKQINNMNNESKMPHVGTMVMYRSNLKSDARELGPHSESVEYPAMVIREGKTDGTLNLTVFVDNQGIGDSYHRASGTISRKNVPHRDQADPNQGTWFEIEESISEYEFDFKAENIPNELVDKLTGIGYELNENHSLEDLSNLLDGYTNSLNNAINKGFTSEQNNQPTITEINAFLDQFQNSIQITLSRGYEVPDNVNLEYLSRLKSEYMAKRDEIESLGFPMVGKWPTISELEDHKADYDNNLKLATANGFESKNNPPSIFEIMEFQQNIERNKLIDKLKEVGYVEAGYLLDSKTYSELQDLEASYEAQLKNAYKSGLKERKSKNAKLYTWEEINAALGIQMPSRPE